MAPAVARTAPIADIARVPVATNSYKLRRFTRRLRSFVAHARPMERLAEDRGPKGAEVPTVDDAERDPVPGDHSGGDGVEDDAGPRGPVAGPREFHEFFEAEASEQPRIQTRDRDAEFVEGPLADSEGPPSLDVVARDASAAGDDKELDPRGDAAQQTREIAEVLRVVLPGDEHRTADGDDDFLHGNLVLDAKGNER